MDSCTSPAANPVSYPSTTRVVVQYFPRVSFLCLTAGLLTLTQDAVINILYSAWNNYTNFGSDIGGYRRGPGPLGRTLQLFTRWYQLGAFSPLMVRAIRAFGVVAVLDQFAWLYYTVA